MGMIAFLILFPFLGAGIVALMRKPGPVRKYTIFAFCAAICVAVIYFSIKVLSGGETLYYLEHTHTIDMIMLVVDALLCLLLVYLAVRYRKYYIILLIVPQAALIIWLELTGRAAIPGYHIMVDRLSIIMCLIIGIVGCLICMYAVMYMKDYHNHHKECKDRRAFFFAMLFVFLGAMFGLVLSSNLIWIYFFWEITSICSFLLIGYSKTKEAIHNCFRALWMNLLGGLAFAMGIAYTVIELESVQLQDLVSLMTTSGIGLIPITLLAFAALTKSAQLPFSQWLLGAMVAPTPTSALLHSATMVKAGVYLLLRLAPAMAGTVTGSMVVLVGGFTFLATSMLAISQSDGKKVLAYSTISNLGLITACAGVGLYEAVWAAIFLMIFHAVSKSMLFLSVGAVENNLGSRNIEDMHGLIVRLPGLAFIMIIGIAGMFLAPFGMLISKWAALRAFVDSSSIFMVIFLVFGSATTLFYWAKWLTSLISVLHSSSRLPGTTKGSEWFSLVCHATVMIALCLSFPLVSSYLVEPYLSSTYHMELPAIISNGNAFIMMVMLVAIVIVPVALRLLAFRKHSKQVSTYMGGANIGDDRNFTDSFGGEKPMYLANWYMEDYFGEKKLLRPSILIAVVLLAVFMIIAIGGAL